MLPPRYEKSSLVPIFLWTQKSDMGKITWLSETWQRSIELAKYGERQKDEQNPVMLFSV